MIKIEDFAHLGQVSVVTLRHYDEVGLLKPIQVDPFNGYRYYSVSQLSRLNRILALKDLGFSLDQIAQILTEDLTLAQLHGMLKRKQAEVKQRLTEEQSRLVRIEARLRQIELEENMPAYDVVLKLVPSMLVASRRVTIPTNDQVPRYLDQAYNDIYSYVFKQGGKDTGPCLAVWHTTADVHANEEAEAIVPIDQPLTGNDRVKVYELPPTRVAAVVHQGSYNNFNLAHRALLQWIEDNGYRVDGPYREIYIYHDPKNAIKHTTEIQYPVVKE